MYTPYLLVLLLCELLINKTVGYSIVMIFWYYFSHQFLHVIPDFNLHTIVHHNHIFNISREFELLLDFIFECIFIIGFPVLFQYFFVTVLPTSIIVFIGIAFALNHILNYSFLPSEKHIAHHLNSTVNFYPDFMDHLFETNSDPKYEDMTQHIPSLVQACIIVHFVKAYFQWKD